MPRRPLPKIDPAVLEAIELALSKPRVLTAEEEKEFEAFRNRSRIEKVAIRTCVVRRGKTYVFRVAGRAGADLHEHPLGRQLRKAERDYLAGLTKLFRPPPVAAGVKARQRTATARDQQIYDLLDRFAHLGSGTAGAVARMLDVTAKHVRRVKKKRT